MLEKDQFPAHNPKAVGSSPASATILYKKNPESIRLSGFFLCSGLCVKNGFSNTFEKGTVSNLAESQAGGGAFLRFWDFGDGAIVDLLVIVILLGQSLQHRKYPWPHQS